VTLFADFNSSVSVPFQRMRALLLEAGGGLQEGVVGAQAAAGDLKVAQRVAGANLSADVALGAAWIAIDTGTRNGIGHVFSDATFNAGPFTAGNATNPRVDQVILRWNDTSIPTGGGNVPTIEVLTGTATAGATLDNRLGATALPNDCVRLADVLMPVSAASVTTANIRDRRPWARGANFGVNSNNTTDFTSTSGPFAVIDTTVLQQRIECSGVPLEVQLHGYFLHSVANGIIDYGLAVDGAGPAAGTRRRATTGPGAGGSGVPVAFRTVLAPSAGSHLIAPMWSATTAGTMTLVRSGTAGVELTVREIVAQNASNGTA
jgi:hypothetical protein